MAARMDAMKFFMLIMVDNNSDDTAVASNNAMRVVDEGRGVIFYDAAFILGRVLASEQRPDGKTMVGTVTEGMHMSTSLSRQGG
jgi:hypothetical protein